MFKRFGFFICAIMFLGSVQLASAQAERTYDSYIAQCTAKGTPDNPISAGTCDCVYNAQKAVDQERDVSLARKALETLENQYNVFQSRMKQQTGLSDSDLAQICVVSGNYEEKLKKAQKDPVQYKTLMEERNQEVNNLITKGQSQMLSNAIHPALSYCASKYKRQVQKDDLYELEMNYVPEFSGLRASKFRSLSAECGS